MASPDIAAYLGLQFFDIDPQDVYEAGAQQLQNAIPELELREGHIETLLLESVAEEVAESVFAINRLPNGIFESLLKMFGLGRDIGTQPIVNLLFEVNRSDGCTIPAGTSVIIRRPSDDSPIVFSLQDDLVIPEGETEAMIVALGNYYTGQFNGTSANTPAELVDTIAFVDSVKTVSEIYGGRDSESDMEFLARGVQRLSRLTSTLVLPSHFVSAALEESTIERAYALDNYNPANDPDNNGPVGNDPGHITVALYGEEGPVLPEEKDALLDKILPQTMTALKVHLIDGKIQPFNVSATIRVKPGYDPSNVTSNVKAALIVRYSVLTGQWNDSARVNDIISTISSVEGVDFVRTLSEPATNVNPTGVATILYVNNIDLAVE